MASFLDELQYPFFSQYRKVEEEIFTLLDISPIAEDQLHTI
ncbi:hypothetical protein BAOM_2379 [Peribacillus asahii]|uniref:Uncharacterized protein n=1 Tax=Peribacillus asahii TaxID=228899 RepID=A0A3Q9RN28_9BACI|nr:hypothetical protein BAOM_2379 [Peribacillus asahii]